MSAAPANPIAITGAGNSYTGRDGPIAPGELATITLAGLEPDQPADLGYTVPLPMTLAGAQVFFDGERAALAAVVPGTIYCVTPYHLGGTTARSLLRSPPCPAGRPRPASADGSGQGQAYAPNEDGTLNAVNNPAKAGSLVTFYATGLGTPDSSCPYGQLASGRLTPPQPVGSNFSGLTQVYSLAGFVCGIDSVQAQIPAVTVAVPNLLFLAPGSSNRMLRIGVTPVSFTTSLLCP